MKQPKIRIEKILSICPPCNVLADIGCDHGMLSIEAIQQKKAKRVIAADLSKASLQKAMNAAKKMHLDHLISCRCGDGLSVLQPKEVQGIVLAGMGAQLIVHILSSKIEIAKQTQWIVASPNCHPEQLRIWAMQVGFGIDWEEVVEEAGKYYILMRLVFGQKTEYTEQELWLGKLQSDVHLQKAYYQKERLRLMQISQKLLQADRPAELADCQKKINWHVEKEKELS